METPKGTVRHLVPEHGTHTLCGRSHGLNPRYAYAGFPRGDLGRIAAYDGSQTVCARCRKVAR